MRNSLQIYLQLCAISKAMATNLTFVLFPCLGEMESLMLHQCLFVGRHFAAYRTRFGFLDVARSHVLAQRVFIARP